MNTISQFAEITEQQLFEMRHCGAKTVSEILRTRERLLELMQQAVVRGESPCSDSVYCGMFGKPRSAFEKDIPQLVLGNESSDQARWVLEALIQDLSVRARNVIGNNGIDTVEKMLSLDEETLYAFRNSGTKTVREIQALQDTLRESLCALMEEDEPSVSAAAQRLLETSSTKQLKPQSVDESDFDLEHPRKSLLSLLSKLCRSERKLTAFLLRKGMLGEPACTLQETGERMGVTRERARQMEISIEKRCLKNQQAFRPLVRYAHDLVNRSGGVLGVSELTRLLFCRGEDRDGLVCEQPFVEFLAQLPCWSESGLRRDTKGNVCSKDTSALSDRVASLLMDAARDHADEVIDLDLWSISIETLKLAILILIQRDSDYACLDRIPDSAIREAVDQSDGLVLLKDDRLYSRDLYRLRFGKLSALVETVLRRSPRPMHFTEVYQEVMRVRQDPSINERRVTGALERHEKSILWDRGTYVHRDNVSIPYSLLHEIEHYLDNELDKGVPFLSVSGVYELFGKRCASNGLTTETSLYMCLRESSYPRVEYPRYPYIVRRGSERLPVALALEQYVQEAGEPVTYTELRTYATGDLGISEQLVDIHLYQAPNLFRLDKGVFLHADQLALKAQSLSPLITYVVGMLDREGHVSAKKIFDDKRITCSMLGIKTPYLLHSVLVTKSGDVISGRYPQLVLTGGSDERAGITGAMIEHVRAKRAPCSFRELEEEFVSRRGYQARTVYALPDRECILSYAASSVVHADCIGWSEQHQLLLESLANTAYLDATKAGRAFALVDRFVEAFYDQLPALDNDVFWTEVLAAHLLSKYERFFVIGNGGNAFVPSENQSRIETLEDLVHGLLMSDYGGASTLDAVEAELQSIGVIRKRLTVQMLGSQEKVRISGNVISAVPTC